jgi:hypothetical protein
MNCANHPDRERVAFCQNCGKPLCSECTRTIGTAVFCEPCLAARLAAADTATSAAGTPYGYAAGTAIPPVPGAPNPALAGLLGLIPGVGAMYNGQYAKGVVHLIIFAVLVSLTDSSGLFGLFVAGWVFYQVFEAYHTARARRDGTPLPNAFGLNDIGERFGFGKSWPGPVSAAGGAAAPPTPPPAAGGSAYTPPAASQSYVAHDGTQFVQGSGGGQHFVGNDGSYFTQGPGGQQYGGPGTYGSGWGAVPPVPPVPPYSAHFVGGETNFPTQQNRFPVGAILLIAFGVLFFFGSSGWFRHFPVQRLLPFLLIGFGVWMFIHKMSNTGLGIADDGTPAYRLRVFRAMRGAVWIILVGVLFFLDSFYILSWAHSWPLFIIVAGLMTFLERSAYSAAAATPYNYQTAGPIPPVPGPFSAPSTSSAIVPVAPQDEEGR